MGHINNFEEFLITKNLDYEKIDLDDNNVGFKFYQSIENGPRLLLGAVFTDEEDIVDLKIFNITTITNPLKKETYLSLINDLNESYRYTKFVIDNDAVVTSTYSMPLPNFQYDYSQTIINSLVMMFDTVKESFPKFMRIQWS